MSEQQPAKKKTYKIEKKENRLNGKTIHRKHFKNTTYKATYLKHIVFFL